MIPKISIFLGRKMFTSKKGKEFFTYAGGYQGTFALSEENNYNKKKNKYYPVLNITTERQLVLFIYNRFCHGKTVICNVMAHQRGRRTPFSFWRGEIGPEGYKFYKNEVKSKDLESLRKVYDSDLSEAESYEEEQDLYANFLEEKKELRDERKYTKYGFFPYLKSSGKRGIFHSWDDPDEGLIKREVLTKINKKRDFDNLSIDELNEF